MSELYAITDWPLSAALVWIATRDERRADQAAALPRAIDRAAALLAAVDQPLRRAVSLFGPRILDAIDTIEEHGPDGKPTGRVNHVVRHERAVEVLGADASKVFDTVEEHGPDGQPTGRLDYVMRPEWQTALLAPVYGLDPVETFAEVDAEGRPTGGLVGTKHAGAGPMMALRRALRDGRLTAYGDPGIGRLEGIPAVEWAELEFDFDNCARAGGRTLRWRRVVVPKESAMAAFQPVVAVSSAANVASAAQPSHRPSKIMDLLRRIARERRRTGESEVRIVDRQRSGVGAEVRAILKLLAERDRSKAAVSTVKQVIYEVHPLE